MRKYCQLRLLCSCHQNGVTEIKFGECRYYKHGGQKSRGKLQDRILKTSILVVAPGKKKKSKFCDCSYAVLGRIRYVESKMHLQIC